MSLALLFTDGFDIVDFQSTTLKYFTGISIPFYQGRVVNGPNSAGAISIDNTAGNTVTLSAAVGSQSILFWNGNIQINSTSFAKQVFLVFGTAAVTLLQVQINASGTISLLDGSGGVIATSSAALSLNGWYWLEVNAVYGTSGSYEVWLCAFGGTPAKILSGSISFASTLPNQFQFVWNSPGSYSLQLDNVTIWTGSALSDRNGPSRVAGLIAQKIVLPGGWAFNGPQATSLIQAIADSGSAYVEVPDGARSYDTPGTSNLMLLVAPSPCTGLVLGLSLNVAAAPLAGPVSMTLVANERTGPYVIGMAPVASYNLVFGDPPLNGYATYQAICQFNEEGSNWNDLQISTTQWGIEPAQVAVTQVYLEKIVDLTGRKFGCGEASYSF